MEKRRTGRRVATESDVAALAGVSQSAVSRAFTPGASVAEDTRAKILKAAQSLGYHPNLLARSLATRRSNIVALAVSNLENPFYAQIVKELSDQLRVSGRHILLFTTPGDEDVEDSLERVLSYQIDALVMSGTTASLELALQCQKAGVPVVQINRESNLAGISTVRGQNRRAGELIAAFLLAGEHKRFAFIGGTEQSNISRVRQESYAGYLAQHGVTEVQVGYGNYTFEGAATAARTLLRGRGRPDAIFCASDYMALAVIDVARRELGMHVPGDLSIVGFDNVPEAAHSAYGLTTFSQPAGALVAEAIKIIDVMSASPGGRAQRREVKGDLIIRTSARLPGSGLKKQDSGNLVWSPA